MLATVRGQSKKKRKKVLSHKNKMEGNYTTTLGITVCEFSILKKKARKKLWPDCFLRGQWVKPNSPPPTRALTFSLLMYVIGWKDVEVYLLHIKLFSLLFFALLNTTSIFFLVKSQQHEAQKLVSAELFKKKKKLIKEIST